MLGGWPSMKYFFLTEGWGTGRVWSTEGLWTAAQWRRPPQIEPLPIVIEENGERLVLYRVEPMILMVEVRPDGANSPSAIGQVVLKRLISADQVLDRLGQTGMLAIAPSLIWGETPD
jgi:hypothetical protein